MTSQVDFYHYTSRSGLNGIISSGYIRRNSALSKHAHFGPGTYGTSMPPSHGKYRIAVNNWTRCHGQNYIRSGSVECAIKVKIPSKEVRRVGGRRDILVHEGPIYLKDYEWEKMEVSASSTISLSRDLDDVMIRQAPLQDTSSESVYCCARCGKDCRSGLGLHIHSSRCLNKSTHCCPRCGRDCRSGIGLYSHSRRCLNKSTHCCVRCGRDCRSGIGLYSHSRRCSDKSTNLHP